MQKSKILFIVLLCVAVAIAVGFIVLMIFTTGTNIDRHQWSIELKDGTVSQTLSVSLDNLAPSESDEYTISVNAKSAGTYDFTIGFQNPEFGGLEKYVCVKILMDGEQVLDDEIQNCLLGETVRFQKVVADPSQAVKISVIYSIPSSVGNEAQKTTLDFDIALNVERQ